MSKFIHLGIHTRLQNLINKSGGLDMDARCMYLSKEYDVPESVVRTVARYDIEDLLSKGVPLQEALDEILRRHNDKIQKSSEELRSVTNLLRRLMG